MSRTKRPPVVAVISSKGGVGKTTVAVSLASIWSATQPVLLIDLDTQDTGSACWWLDRSNDDAPNLEWMKAATVADHQADGQLVIIDTPPRIDDAAIRATARAADLVIVPGAPTELAAITQTARTIASAAPDVKIVAVFTKATTQHLGGAWALAANEALGAIGVEVVGQIRQAIGLASAPFEGNRPDQLSGRSHLVTEDIEQLAATIERLSNAT